MGIVDLDLVCAGSRFVGDRTLGATALPFLNQGSGGRRCAPRSRGAGSEEGLGEGRGIQR